MMQPVMPPQGSGGTILDLDDVPASHATSLPLPGTITDNLYVVEQTESPANSQSRALLVVLLFVILALGVIHFTGEHEDPIANLMDFVSILWEGESQIEVTTEAPAEPTANPEVEPTPEVAPPARPQFDPQMVQNPYWILPNELPKHAVSLGRKWSAKEEEMWRFALDHEFVYQRYKAVKEMRARRLAGSSELLFKALEQPKFWTRMEAVMALAEFGYPVTVGQVKQAIGRTRSSLVANYMKRFIAKRTPGEAYVLRHALKFVDGRARATILEALAHERESHELYFAAATFDPSPRVRKWLELSGESSVKANVMEQYQQMVVDDFEVRRQQRGKPTMKEEEGRPAAIREEEAVDDVIFFEAHGEPIPGGHI